MSAAEARERRIPRPCLALVTDRTLAPELVTAVDRAAAGGVDLVQLREKDLPALELHRLAGDLREVTRGRCLLVINDRVDVALAVGADGVHLGEDGLPVAAARRIAPEGFLIGRSVHDVDGAVYAARDGADYLLAGTVFPSRSHPGGPTGGTDLIRRVRSAVGSLPLLGIGGITVANVGDVLRAGADGAAVISAVLGRPDPAAAVDELRRVMAGARGGSPPRHGQ